MIDIKTDDKLDLTSYTVTGELLCYDIVAIANSFYNGKITKHVLWDLLNGNASKLTTDDIQKIAKAVKNMSASRKEGKTAIVVSSTMDYGLGRMLEIFGEIENLPFEMNVFYSIYEAKTWLKQ